MKRIIKETLLSVSALIKQDYGGKVVFYHDVHSNGEYAPSSTSLDAFKEHIEVAKELGFRLVDKAPLQERTLQICLDDGFRGVWESREYFLREKIHPTVSLAVDLIGRPGYLTWDEIHQLKDDGFRFISHTWSHRSLTDLSEQELPHELQESRNSLSHQLGCEVTELCFPRGKFSPKIVNAALSAGYQTLYSSIPGTYGVAISHVPYGIVPRILVQQASRKEFAAVLRGGATLLQGRYRKQQFSVE